MVPRQILETFSPADPSLMYSMSYSYSTTAPVAQTILSPVRLSEIESTRRQDRRRYT